MSWGSPLHERYSGAGRRRIAFRRMASVPSHVARKTGSAANETTFPLPTASTWTTGAPVQRSSASRQANPAARGSDAATETTFSFASGSLFGGWPSVTRKTGVRFSP